MNKVKLHEGAQKHMKLIIQRFIAIIILVLPGILAAYGVIVIRDVIFDYIALAGEEKQALFQWWKLLWGLLCFLGGASFISGWVYFRDKKRNYVVPRFKKRSK